MQVLIFTGRNWLKKENRKRNGNIPVISLHNLFLARYTLLRVVKWFHTLPIHSENRQAPQNKHQPQTQSRLLLASLFLWRIECLRKLIWLELNHYGRHGIGFVDIYLTSRSCLQMQQTILSFQSIISTVPGLKWQIQTVLMLWTIFNRNIITNG